MHFLKIHRPGYRVVKTVIAATLTLLVCSGFSEMSPVLALMGVYCAMGRTIRESWRECLNQMVGVIVGSVLGFLLLRLIPEPPFAVIGLSLFFVIGLCNLLRVSYAVFLSSVIFISVCTGASQLPDILARIRDVSIGLAFGLGVNIFIHPYANEGRVETLLRQLQSDSLLALLEMTDHGRYPDMKKCEQVSAKLAYELTQMRQQAALLKTKKNQRALAWEEGCVQLAERMVQEVAAIASMDSFGSVSAENRESLAAIEEDYAAEETEAPDAPEKPVLELCGTKEQNTVLNYHIGCYCRAYRYLCELLALRREEAALKTAAEPAENADNEQGETEDEKTRQGNCGAEAH